MSIIPTQKFDFGIDGIQYVQSANASTDESLTPLLQVQDLIAAAAGAAGVYPMSGDIDGTSVAVTTVFTTAADLGTFVVEHVILIPTVVNTVTIHPTFSFGTNPTDYDDCLALTSSIVPVLNKPVIFSTLGSQLMILPNTDIKMNITVGGTATALTFVATVRGFYTGL